MESLLLQLVMSSDKLGDIQKPVLNLDLDIMENGQQRMESIELNQTELERLISSLEAANKVERTLMCTFIKPCFKHLVTCILHDVLCMM